MKFFLSAQSDLFISILAVMVISWLFFKAHYPLPIVLSFIPVFVGTLISTYYDLQFNTFGLFCKYR